MPAASNVALHIGDTVQRFPMVEPQLDFEALIAFGANLAMAVIADAPQR